MTLCDLIDPPITEDDLTLGHDTVWLGPPITEDDLTLGHDTVWLGPSITEDDLTLGHDTVWLNWSTNHTGRFDTRPWHCVTWSTNHRGRFDTRPWHCVTWSTNHTGRFDTRPWHCVGGSGDVIQSVLAGYEWPATSTTGHESSVHHRSASTSSQPHLSLALTSCSCWIIPLHHTQQHQTGMHRFISSLWPHIRAVGHLLASNNCYQRRIQRLSLGGEADSGGLGTEVPRGVQVQRAGAGLGGKAAQKWVSGGGAWYILIIWHVL